VQNNSRSCRDIQRIESFRHGNPHALCPADQPSRQAGSLRAEQHGVAKGRTPVGKQFFSSWAKRHASETVAVEQRKWVIPARNPGERHKQRRAYRHTDRLAVQRVTAIGVQRDRLRAEGGCVAENSPRLS